MPKEFQNTVKLPLPPKPEGNGKHVTGIVSIASQKQFANELITIGRDFDEALGRTVLPNHNFLLAVTEYKSLLMEFEMAEELLDLVSLINGLPAIGGYQREQAVMANAQLYYPGIGSQKHSKEARQAMIEIQKSRNSNVKDRKENPDGG